MSKLDIDAIEERANAATPGPWQWFGNTKTRSVDLSTVHGGRRHVMNFWRWGMSGAQPAFQVSLGPPVEPGSGFMMKLSEMEHECPNLGPKFEVDHRRDFVGIAHPDAEFIAHAREDIPTLIAEVRRLEAERDALRERISAECDILAEEFESDGIDWGEKLKCAMKTLDALREAVEE